MMGELPAFLRGVILLGVMPGIVGIQLFSCGFETGFCGMIQSTNDNFDWERHNGGTETLSTGPSSAYKGTFYIYIEATEAPSGYVAEVETGMLQHSGTLCVTFAYHMYGIGVGELAVGIKPDDTYNWRVFNDQGDHWRLGTAEVGLRQGDRVAFRVVRSSDSRGDVALDDIVIRTGGCRTTEPLPFSCSFEEGFCGMLQRNDDQLDWTRFDGPTDNTGPQEAADGTWFIYIATDYPRVNSDVARIETPAIDFRGHICVRFKYHMSGYNVGFLVAHIMNAAMERSIFDVRGDQGSEWQTVAINVTEMHSGDWLRFSGQPGPVTRGVGVDDVLISPGWCNDCHVKNGGCDHICTGSGTCSCRQGYTLEETHKCVDVNECTESTDGCSYGCQNTVGSYRCTCPDGMSFSEDGFSCTATLDCSGSYGADCSRPCHCADQAPCDLVTGACPDGRCSPGWSGVACDQATPDCSGSYGADCSRPCHCADQAPCDPVTGACPDEGCSPGWIGVACDQDVNECLSNEICQQLCQNLVGSYSCGCHSGYILTDDRRKCKDCDEVYNQIVDVSQTFESSCETDLILYNTPHDPCLREACRRGVEVVAIRNEVCDLKRCENSDVQLEAFAGSVGWNIFKLNLTWSELIDDKSSADQGHSDFPLWQVIVAVTVVVFAVIALVVGIAVYLKRRMPASERTEPATVYYENDAVLTTRPIGDVTKQGDEAPYDDVGYLHPLTADAAQIQMSHPGADPEYPNPGDYEDLDSYEPHVWGPYDDII